MYPANSQKFYLSRQISIPNPEGATVAAGSMPADDAGEVLKDMAGDSRSSVRMAVLDVASKFPSEGASLAILSRLRDESPGVRSIANSLIAMIAQKSVVPEIFKSLEQNPDLAVKGALARQVGMIGDATDIPRLRRLYQVTVDSGLRNDLSLAMARLGDNASRQQLIQRLSAPEVAVRLAALNDTLYIGDRRMARYFRPVVEDRRDVIVISFPHDPTVWARICDVAIATLAALGLRLPFETVPTRRFTEAEIQQTLPIVTMLENLP